MGKTTTNVDQLALQIFVQTCIVLDVCVCACVRACVHVCMHVCVRACVCVGSGSGRTPCHYRQ